MASDKGDELAVRGQENDNYVWYHDLKWNVSALETAIDRERGADGVGGRQVTLKLSDGTQVNLRIKSLDQLKGLISELERAI